MLFRSGYRANNAVVPNLARRDRRSAHIETKLISEVFDLVNCGPRRRFVVQGIDGEPLIVHNCENVTQAAAHDILREALRQLDNVVLHVHDEIVVETPENEAEQTLARVQQVMATSPDWAERLPLTSEGKIMRRYGK